MARAIKNKGFQSEWFYMAYYDYFDGERWNRDSVVERQRHWAKEHVDWELRNMDVLSDPLDSEFVERFESTFQVTLPSEYRSFLLQVGDGGIGPGLALRRLGSPFNDSEPWAPGEIYLGEHEPNRHLHQPFRHTHFFEPEPWETESWEDWAVSASGGLFLFDYGCASWVLLVVTGKQAGEIWIDEIVNSKGLHPIHTEDGDRVGFAEFYCNWLQHGRASGV